MAFHAVASPRLVARLYRLGGYVTLPSARGMMIGVVGINDDRNAATGRRGRGYNDSDVVTPLFNHDLMD